MSKLEVLVDSSRREMAGAAKGLGRAMVQQGRVISVEATGGASPLLRVRLTNRMSVGVRLPAGEPVPAIGSTLAVRGASGAGDHGICRASLVLTTT
ncbi:hypothetical protein [Kribbella deserti]|uniref:Uncharacterized protein n=1 Tax=Kribbella deserti TaxID=1926257 RepID=A0ABV6QNN2_9ACTN